MKDLMLLKFPPQIAPVNPVLNDIEFGDNDCVMVEGPARRQQDIAKILITEAGANPIFPTYGSSLPDIPGSRDTPQILSQISDGVIQALGFLDQVDRSSRLDEKIQSIADLSVETDPSDTRSKSIILSVLLGNGQIVATSTQAGA